ncbi:MAG TPA: hypothetical protein VN089_27495 [Duganella sp.]|nr:hypothetical protein [Duganella sp.]
MEQQLAATERCGSAALLSTDDARTGEVMQTNSNLAHYVLRDPHAIHLKFSP